MSARMRRPWLASRWRLETIVIVYLSADAAKSSLSAYAAMSSRNT
jgi:hypothetical protein